MPSNIFQPLEIVTYDTDLLNCSSQANNYSELVFVEEGRGYRMLDEAPDPFSNRRSLHAHSPRKKYDLTGSVFPPSFYQVPADPV